MTAIRLYRPHSVAEAVARLAADEGARPLAGGASMVAMMNAGLLAPSAIVSLRDIRDLAGIAAGRDGIRIGAMTRHRETASAAPLEGTLSVLREAAGAIANPPVRNMGTMGGSISLADPAADYPPALVAAGAAIEIAGAAGTRRVPAQAFFVDWYATVLAPGELVTAILLPPPTRGIGLYHKLARVAGDFAIASVALSAEAGGAVRVAIGGCGPKPVASAEADGMLTGRLADARAIEAAGRLLAGLADPVDDVRGSADYRRLLIPRLLRRAVAEAVARLERAA